MTKIRTILFDMDGVLVNAKNWHFEALNKALIIHGFEPISYEDHLAHYDGLPTRKKLALLSQAQKIPVSQFEEINATKQRLTLEISQEKCKPTAQHVRTVMQLKADGYQLAVCSNSVRASVDLLLEKTSLLPLFEFTLSNEDVSNPKPHPEIYQMAMERFGTAPGHTLILEDNINGILAARSSGGHVLEIRDSSEVTYEAIRDCIAGIEGGA